MVDGSTKKRKRVTNGAADEIKQKKAVHFNEAHITVNLDASDANYPSTIVAHTPSSEPPGDLTFAAYGRTRRKKPKLLLHSATHPRLDFTAASVSQNSVRGRETQYIGVYDPEKNSLELVPAGAVMMKSTLKKTFAEVRSTGPQADEDDVAGKRINYGERRTALGEAFGTKKAKKALKNAAANAVAAPAAGTHGEERIPITAATEAVIQSAKEAEGIEGSNKESFKKLVEEAHPRPRPNVDAEVPSDVYKLTRLVKRDELDAVNVEGWKNSMAGGSNIKLQSRFVGHRVLAIGEQSDDQKLKALKYLYALILWTKALQTKGKDGSRSLPPRDKMPQLMPGIDSNTRDSLRKKFAPAGRLSPWDTNKVMLHACALAITIDDCTTEMHDLQEDLKLSSKEIKAYYKELGCQVEEKADRQHAFLRLPFQLPEVRQRRVVRR